MLERTDRPTLTVSSPSDLVNCLPQMPPAANSFMLRSRNRKNTVNVESVACCSQSENQETKKVSSLCSPAVDSGKLPLVSEAEPGVWTRPSEGASLCLLGPGAPPTAPCGDPELDQYHLRLGLDNRTEHRTGRH